MIKAINTEYKGYLFRSRLEARWAIFLDEMGIHYKYEEQGYNINGEWYLPDFWIGEWNCWLEVKPEIPTIFNTKLEPIERKEYWLCMSLAKEANKTVLLVGGDPWIDIDAGKIDGTYKPEYEVAVFTPYYIKETEKPETSDGIELNIKVSDDLNYSRLFRRFYYSDDRLYGHLVKNQIEHPYYFSKNVNINMNINELIEIDKEYYYKKFGRNHHILNYGIIANGYEFIFDESEIKLGSRERFEKPHEKIMKALKKARQIRF